MYFHKNSVMHYLYCVFFLRVLLGNCENVTEKNKYENINYVAEALVNLFGMDEDNIRIRDLRDKLTKIDKFVVDNDKLADFLMNETASSNLNETTFFTALNETDHFKFLSENESKNLYLKLKEKMNRDDILDILKEHNKRGGISKSARKMMKSNLIGKIDVGDAMVDTVVDKLIAEVPSDKHKFNYTKEDNKYWDPQSELEDLEQFHRHDGRRIFKGERTTIRYYPFMVSVHVMGRFWCGGVIYWHDIVLTSAACLQLMHNNRLFRENPSVLRVRVGSNHSRIGGEMIEALEVYFHPAYNPRTLNNNIAIIRLRRHLFFTYHRIPKIINISYNADGLAPTSEVLVLGWGVSKMSQMLSYEPIFLNRKFLPIYPNVFCKEVYGDKFISKTMFCAGTFTTGEGACDHDAGGPAVMAGKLVGIISFGPSVCGYPNAPTVFTLVGAYADWIETVNETMPGYYRGRKRTTTASPFRYYSDFKPKKIIIPELPDLKTDPPQTPSEDRTTTPSTSRKRKKLKRADNSDIDGFSIDLK
ncbi:uncharacterized protein LOC126777193 [Nymphalis io]|uniref:uncharacterized protein LOC126777193 n=1 Tax=Inachis io TaxID=171585 RepID=UPI0021683884|nr:uncharacterized protein LOC126777193 [Nymphalis io]